MLLRQVVPLFLAGCAGALTACGPDVADREGPLAPSYDDIPISYDISGTIYGPSGGGICDDFLEGTVSVRLISPGPPPTQAFLVVASCPSGGPITYAATLPAGTYYLVVSVLGTTMGSFSLRYADPVPVLLAGSTVRDVHVLAGAPLGGRATLDGQPAGGVLLTVVHELPVGSFARVQLESLPTGLWREITPDRAPPYLQTGLHYTGFGSTCTALGTAPGILSPAEPFLFPQESGEMNLAFTSNDASERTHFSGRLAVTTEAGDIGAQSSDLCTPGRGLGWGVQFPVGTSGPLHLPLSSTHLYRGGLMVGFAPDVVLTGTSLGGFDLRCGGPNSDQCHDFGADATVHVASPEPHGKFITWRYSDASSAESQGLRVTQRSFDGAGDYVLFQYTFLNGGRRTQTFWAGTWMDWDIDDDATDDMAGMALDGQLMFMTNTAGGNHLGTLILGAPASGAYAYGNGDWHTTAEQVNALRGVGPRYTPGPADVRNIHGAGPFTLRKGYSTTMWIAIVAGEDFDSMLAAATAAQADFERRVSAGQ